MPRSCSARLAGLPDFALVRRGGGAMRPFDDIVRIEHAEILDKPAAAVRGVVTRVLTNRKVKDALHGVWLGHPLHPPLTDLPIGFWTSAFVLDVIGTRRARPAADALVGLGEARDREVDQLMAMVLDPHWH